MAGCATVQTGGAELLADEIEGAHERTLYHRRQLAVEDEEGSLQQDKTEQAEKTHGVIRKSQDMIYYTGVTRYRGFHIPL